MVYVATFISGCSKVVKQALEERNYHIITIMDGIVEFSSSSLNINDFPIFNNIYILLNKTNNYSIDINDTIEELTTDNIDFALLNNHYNSKGTFRIRVFNENQPVKIDYKRIVPFEKLINRKTNLVLDEKKNDYEFTILRRKERITYLLFKLTYKKDKKFRSDGALTNELANILLKYADFNESNILLDPFCGSGSICKCALKYFKYNMFFVSDNDEEKVIKLKSEFKKNKKKLYIKLLDATKMTCFENDFIDVIITDPPWNIYNHQDKSFVKFYQSMLEEFVRVLKPQGKMIILMGNKWEFELALKSNDRCLLKDKLNILVNGKKANIYYIEKRM